MSSENPVDPDRWVAIERGIGETVKAVSERLKWLEDEKARRPEQVNQAEAICARKGPRKRPQRKPTKSQVEKVEHLEAEYIAAKGKPRSLRPAWWWKVEELIVVLQRNLVKDAADKIENEINHEVGGFYSWVTPKAVDEAEHYRERVDAEEESARWLQGYLAEPWLLNYMRANLIAQKPPADDDLPDELQEWIKDLPTDDTPGLRMAYRRDHLWLKWHNQLVGKVSHFHAVVRNRWNDLPEAHRKIISPRLPDTIGTDKSGSETVRTSIKKAQEEPKVPKPKSARTKPNKPQSRKKI